MTSRQRSLLGLAGIIALAFATEMNEQVSAQALLQNRAAYTAARQRYGEGRRIT